MSWIPPVSKAALKYGVKYGPQAKELWNHAGKQVSAAAKAKLDDRTARRAAFDEAGTVVDGSVLRRAWQGSQVYVVFSGDQPVRAYPQVAELDQLVANADLGKRQTPEEFRDAQLPAKARRARDSATAQARSLRKRPQAITGPPTDDGERSGS